MREGGDEARREGWRKKKSQKRRKKKKERGRVRGNMRTDGDRIESRRGRGERGGQVGRR